MKKAAFFVEGQTEQIFVKRLITEIAGSKNIRFKAEKFYGGSYSVLEEEAADDAPHYALVVDCARDSKVKSAILERRDGLLKNGYSSIIGLRDLHPLPLSDLNKLKKGLAHRLPTADLPTHIVVAVMEVESWFLCEHSHFKKVHEDLDVDRIKIDVGIDLLEIDIEQVHNPAHVLNSCYQLVGLSYEKRKSQVEKLLECIDFNTMYYDCAAKSASLREFIYYIDNFLE